jgi:serine/threonine protein kinase/tetratricopeptide (TPR) repeat protein
MVCPVDLDTVSPCLELTWLLKRPNIRRIAASSQLVGQMLGHYLIMRQLGAGGMGIVYSAHDERLDRDVALKVLPTGALADENARKLFHKEATTLSKLNHPNIASIYDFDTEHGIDFLVMEYVSGMTLAEMTADKPLTEKDVLEIGQQVAAALADAHEQRVVHRDLKPGNVMVTSKRRVKLLDFGLAKLLNSPRPEELTQSFSAVEAAAGTVPYMAPEQLRGEESDFRTDVYSVGAVLYEISTGRRPFEGNISTVLADNILHQTPVPPRHLRTELSPNLQALILKCLEKSPKLRYQSATELGTDLERLRMSAPLVKSSFFKHPSKMIDSLAVLPFENASADSEMDYLSDGITETIINSLSQFQKLRVVPRNTVFRYKGREIDLRTIGRELNVRAVLMGRVVQHGENLIVKAELVDVVNESQLWGEHYNRKFSDIFAVQTVISQEISDRLKLKLTGKEKTKLVRRHTDDVEAYQAYLKGRYYWSKRVGGALPKAIKYFHQALDRDPNYALAYTGLADSYVVADLYSTFPSKEAMPKARAAATKALAIDDTLSEAHTSLGFVELTLGWNWPVAEREFKRGIELNERYSGAHEWYAIGLLIHGRTEESLKEMKRALVLDPLSLPVNMHLGQIFYLSRDYDGAIKQYEKALEIDPDFLLTRHWLALSYVQKGMKQEAIAELRALDLSGGYTWALASLGCIYGMCGQKRKAEHVIQRLKEGSTRKYICSYDIALVYAGLGDKDQAFHWLERAFDERFVLLFLLKAEPLFDSLRSDPRFQDLVRRIGLSQ